MKISLPSALCYANDLALLVPCASAFLLMLQERGAFAKHGLKFNASKTQLICFGLCKSSICGDSSEFCGVVLSLLDSVMHIGHILMYYLSHSDDIISKPRDHVVKLN